MTEITEPTLKLCWNEHAIRRAAEVLRAAGLQLMAEDVEAQFPKPAIVEPEQFGSMVRAKSPQDPLADLLWTPTPRRRHYWMSVSGLCEVWSELTDVEVLRVGLGDHGDAFSRGWDAALDQVRKYVVRYASSARTEPHKAAYKEALDRIAELVGEAPEPAESAS